LEELDLSDGHQRSRVRISKGGVEKMKKLLALGIAIAIAQPAMATLIVDEDFEGYADTAAMQANWGAAGLGTLDAGFGNPGQSAAHLGGTVNSWGGSAFSLIPAAGAEVVLTADIYDDGGSANERMTVGLRNGATPLFEMGHYNGTTEHYHIRVLNMYGGGDWQPISAGLKASSGQPAGWNRYQAIFTDSTLTVTIDLGADGSIDGTFVAAGAPSANPFVDLRFGGPSNLSSAGGGVSYDNIRLEVIPEPATLSLLALGGMALLRRRR
jgi:hypothetical protein